MVKFALLRYLSECRLRVSVGDSPEMDGACRCSMPLSVCSNPRDGRGQPQATLERRPPPCNPRQAQGPIACRRCTRGGCPSRRRVVNMCRRPPNRRVSRVATGRGLAKPPVSAPKGADALHAFLQKNIILEVRALFCSLAESRFAVII